MRIGKEVLTDNEAREIAEAALEWRRARRACDDYSAFKGMKPGPSSVHNREYDARVALWAACDAVLAREQEER